MTRLELKTNVKSNLREAGISNGRYQDTELDAVIQDAYNDIAARSRCIIKNDVLAFEDNRVYYDLIASGITDYMGYIALYNDNTQLWLKDCFSRRDLDLIRTDWEAWNGQPAFVISHSLKRVIVVPKMVQAVGTFQLIYWATAPVLTLDTDVFLIAPDMTSLLEDYVTGTLLEDDEEITKAVPWISDYEKNLVIYTTRCANLAKTDYMRRLM